MWLAGYPHGMYWMPVPFGTNPWFLQNVPPGTVTVNYSGVPYYYMNGNYYIWSPYYDTYVIANSSAGANSQTSTQSHGQGGRHGVLSLKVLPEKGQSAQQTANDRYACYRRAVARSGFNPLDTVQDAHATAHVRNEYRRVLIACLKARGYTVRY